VFDDYAVYVDSEQLLFRRVRMTSADLVCCSCYDMTRLLDELDYVDAFSVFESGAALTMASGKNMEVSSVGISLT